MSGKDNYGKWIAVIPAYEPGEGLIALVKAAVEAKLEPIVVDDGSGSAYGKVFLQAQDYAKIISYEDNRGKGYALKRAFSYIRENYHGGYVVVVMDCDGQHSVQDAARLCREAQKDPGSLYLGSRRQSKESPLRSRFGNAVTRRVFCIATGKHIYDTQTGLRAFSSDIMEQMEKVAGERYEYEMNVLLDFARQKIAIKEFPVETIYIDNNVGTHFDPVRDSARIYKEIFKFSAASFASFLVDYVLYSMLLTVLGTAYMLPSNVIARIASAAFNYTLNRRVVFRAKDSLWKSAYKYAILAVCVLAANSALLLFLGNICGMNPYVAKVIVELALFLINWMVQRTFIFRRRQRKVEDNG